ncbi:MAG: hypothetical protein R2753_03330 [Chitinophagales bacterium]
MDSEDEFIGVALEEYCEKHPEHDTDLEMYFQEIKFVLLTISRKEALQYLRQYEKEFNHIESILK